MQLGALAAVVVFALAAWLARRPWLAPLLLGAGTASWGAARLLQHVIDEDPPVVRLSRVILHGAPAPGFAFPPTHVAVVAAMATVARSELSRPARRLAWLIVGLVALARVYVGTHLPADVLGGLGLGWAVGALVNLVVGVRPAVPDGPQLSALLAGAGRPALTVRPLSVTGDGAARFVLETATGPRFMKALGRDDPESDWMRRAWRFLAFRQAVEGRVPNTAAHRVDHEAYVTLLAERAGVAVAPLLATWSTGTTDLIERAWIDGRRLEPADATHADLLRAVWSELEHLEAAGVAPRLLPSSQIVVDGLGAPWIIDLGDARVGATTDAIVASRAAALTDLALVVGIDAAVSSCRDTLGAESLAETLPFLQPVDLPTGLRQIVNHRTEWFNNLRDAVAVRGGVVPPTASSRPVRVAARNLLPLAAAGAAIYILFGHLGQAGAAVGAMRSANPAWLVAAAVAAAATYVCAGAAVISASPVRLPFWRTVSAQVAAASANRASPAGLGGMALNLRYLEMNGATRAQAGAVIALIVSTGFVLHTIFTTAVVIAVGRGAHSSLGRDLDLSWPLLVIALAVSTVAGIAVWYWRLHRRGARLVRTAAKAITEIARTPTRLLTLVGASAGISLAYTAALDASVHAAGGQLTMTSALIVYFAASVVGALSPTPGGLGPLEAALIAGLSQQGVAAGAAVAGVLTYRVITYWLPVLPGLALVRSLRRRHAL